MDNSVGELAVGAAAVWRVTHGMQAEDGPWHLLSRLREFVRNGAASTMLDCFYCLSAWIAFPFAAGLGSTWTARLLLWPALSGMAILLERATTRSPPNPPPADWYLEAESGVTEGKQT